MHTEPNHRKFWTKEEDEILNNSKYQSDYKTADKLGRTVFAIRQRRVNIGQCKLPITCAWICSEYRCRCMIGNIMREIAIQAKVNRMRYLIALCEEETRVFMKDKYKQELKKLSGIK